MEYYIYFLIFSQMVVIFIHVVVCTLVIIYFQCCMYHLIIHKLFIPSTIDLKKLKLNSSMKTYKTF